ncbi:FecR family protein [Catalinimonas niigatensis]|uniref:FecR family protein n=1 Tax=Catalinimonas niigatensis TaxID=1397264 RepID=UPI00266688A0|nr:FecR domain-containing protein [Catalinimonas niigatensis]WPP51809.1 FecR domain-containing protein [Catalinimonas niigatensis]
MSEKKYSVKDYLLNESFQQWVKAPNEENIAYWQHYQKLHPEAQLPIQEARSLILQLDFEEEKRSKATRRRIKIGIDEAIRKGAEREQQHLYAERRSKIKSRYWLGIAASITAIIMLTASYFLFYQAEEFTTYATAYGETKTLLLPDNSVVRLNANSSLRIAEESWQNVAIREVWLEGEAFFEVEKSSTKEGELAKFVVYSGKVKVEVLGTKFNVNSRRRQTSIVLSSGKVKLNIDKESEREEVMMVPGDRVEVDEQRQEVGKSIVDPALYTSWTENKLVFENTPLHQIKKLLEDNYGFEVRISNQTLLSREFTGVAPADDIAILLDKLSIIYNLNITSNEEQISIEEY